MNGDSDMKHSQINLRVTDGEKKRIQALADFFCAGEVSNLQRQLLLACEKALEKHGAKTKWPPELNFYPPGTATQQDLDSTLNLDPET